LKKSNSFKEESSADNGKSAVASSADGKQTADKSAASADESSCKSPKLSRTESIGERTMQKISKVIRGSSRSDSRSKKSREASLSPQGKPLNKKELSSKERRDLYKSSGDRG